MFNLSYNILKSSYLIYNCIINKLYDNDKIISNIIKSIDKSGCMYIKIVQWILPKLELTIGVDKNFKNKMMKYYNSCNIHNLDYSKKVFYDDFGYNIEDKYEILEIIGSGSMGQVYKIKCKKTNVFYAFKILHPEIQNQFKIFKKIFDFFILFINIKKYIPILDFDNFFKELYNQTNLIIEVNNMFEMKRLHNDKLFLIPDVINFSNNIIIMTYLESDNKNDLTDFKTTNLFMKLMLYNLACGYNGICHGDLHSGNWGIRKNKIILYDFGYCLRYNNKEYLIVEDMVLHEERLSSFINFIIYHAEQNSICTKDIGEEYKKQLHEKLGTEYIEINILYKNLLNFMISKNIYISSHAFNGLLSSNNLEVLQSPDISAENKGMSKKVVGELIDICESYDIFNNFKEHIKYKYKREQETSNFEKFDFLKKYI
jgi:tRNA A-37 threonylcarbamoyl transferase component Bud32